MKSDRLGRPTLLARRAGIAFAAFVAVASLLLFWLPLPLLESLDPARMGHQQGFAWTIPLKHRGSGPLRVDGDSVAEPARSRAVLVEGWRLLGPGHSDHDLIRKGGQGRFSHWNDVLYFSSSDGSDPSRNGRAYRLVVGATVSRWLAGLLLAISGLFLVYRFRAEAARVWGGVRSLGAVAAAASPVVLVAIAVLALFARGRDASSPGLRAVSIEFTMIDAQVGRTHARPAPDIAFLGDSSCLMGIDERYLSGRLAPARVANLCTIGYVGPRGYAHMLGGLGEAAGQSVVVVMIHAVQLQRSPSWEPWAEYTITGVDPRQDAGPLATARSALWQSLEPLVFPALPGSYGRRWGSEARLREAVERGEVYDPSDRAPIHFGRPLPASTRFKPIRYESTAEFREAAMRLGTAIERSGRRAYLVLAPVPDSMEDATTRRQREEAAVEISRLLGIPRSAILDTPGSLPRALFATSTHLSNQGRARFSEIVAEPLSRVLDR